MNYKITVRRRLPDGKLQSATYKLEHLYSTGDDKEQANMLDTMEAQTNGEALGNVIPVRVWIEEIN